MRKTKTKWVLDALVRPKFRTDGPMTEEPVRLVVLAPSEYEARRLALESVWVKRCWVSRFLSIHEEV